MDKAKFYAYLRDKFDGLKQEQVIGFEAVLDAIEGAPLSHQAYMLATAWHETNKTMEPVREAYWLPETWRKKNLRYYPWYGRGYVQLTWESNYRKADKELAEAGLINPGDLIANPDMAMKAPLAAFIMRRGMDEGWFTHIALGDVLPAQGVATRGQYMEARRIINGKDDADLIEDYAQIFEKGLRLGGVA